MGDLFAARRLDGDAERQQVNFVPGRRVKERELRAGVGTPKDRAILRSGALDGDMCIFSCVSSVYLRAFLVCIY